MQHCLIADDHPLFREAVSQVLRIQYPELKLSQASDIVSLQALLQKLDDIDLVLLDLHMPGAYGFSALVYIAQHYKNLPILVLSAHEKPEIMHKAIGYGASGFLNKAASVDEIQAAIAAVTKGQTYLPEIAKQYRPSTEHGQQDSIAEAIAALTGQQYIVLTMVAQGLLNKQIAYELDVTEATIKAHLTAIFKKLGVRTRTQLAVAVSHLSLEAPTPESTF